MKTYTIPEKLSMRNISKKDVDKILDCYIRKFLERTKIDETRKFYYESFYVYDEFFRGYFKDVEEFKKYIQKCYKKYLNHSETNCIIDFCSNFLETAEGEQV